MLDPASNPKKSWDHLQAKGLNKGIKTLEQYTLLVTEGLARAYSYLSESGEFVPTLQLLRTVHYLAFGEVHPWAGSFRKPNQSSAIGGYPAADPLRIERELQLANLQYRSMLADERYCQLSAIAFYHARFERIHPFKDGNGRVGRLIMLSQIEMTHGLDNLSLENRTEYLNALKKSPVNLGHLIHYIAGISGMDWPYRLLAPPFRIAPLFYDSYENMPPIEEELEKTRHQGSSSC